MNTSTCRTNIEARGGIARAVVAGVLMVCLSHWAGAQIHPAVRAMNKNEMKQVALACLLYEADQGKLPDRLDVLGKQYLLTPHKWRDEKGKSHDFVLYPVKEKVGARAKMILLSAPKPYPHGKRDVGFADGSVKEMPEAEFRAAMKAQGVRPEETTGRKAPPPPSKKPATEKPEPSASASARLDPFDTTASPFEHVPKVGPDPFDGKTEKLDPFGE